MNNGLRLVLLFSAFSAFSAVNCFASEADDFRARQRAELATLPAPAVPPGDGPEIDRFLAARWAAHNVAPPAAVDDRAFARRVYLDVIGLPPAAEQLEQFAADNAADKWMKLVDALLADRQGYAEGWMAFWNDLLRNDEQTNIDGLRKPITGWLYGSLLENKPLDQFTAELLNSGKDGPDGYLKGVNWRGRVNASQTPPVQAAQNVSQVFLASSIKCASCHDSFINEWKLEQAYGMASFFSPNNLEMARCDKPTGKFVPPKFIFPDLGDVDQNADGPTRLKAVATMVTRPKNPRFARTLVNRLWKRLMGRGLFEPADDFDGRAPKDDLLDWLAYDFMAHDYDAKHTLKLILLSKVYQAPAVKGAKKGKEAPPLLGPAERRLASEQYLDSVSMLTGYWPKADVMNVKVDGPNIRAWRHRKPDNMALALGRPTREQVCTQRDDESTVLQALELVNGAALSSRLREGAKALLASDLGREEDAAKVVRTLYLRALGRPPSEAEAALAKETLGTPKDKAEARQAGWEDFLWALCMNPEMQFVR